MSESRKIRKKAIDSAGKPETAEKRYATKRLLKSKALAGYQKDFARVILKEPFYSVQEAKDILDKALKGVK